MWGPSDTSGLGSDGSWLLSDACAVVSDASSDGLRGAGLRLRRELPPFRNGLALRKAPPFRKGLALRRKRVGGFSWGLTRGGASVTGGAGKTGSEAHLRVE